MAKFKVGDKVQFKEWSYNEKMIKPVKEKDYSIENHICRFNDGEEECECYIKGIKDFRKMMDKLNQPEFKGWTPDEIKLLNKTKPYDNNKDNRTMGEDI